MKNKNIFLIAAVMLLAAICMAQTTYAQNKDFRAQAGELILKGEFKKTEKLLNGLPKKTKTENRFTIDSIQQTMYRIRKDFSLSPTEGRAQIEKRMGHAVSNEKIDYWKRKRYIETDTIDGKEMWFRRGVGNFFLLNNEDFKSENAAEKKSTNNYYAKFYNEAMNCPADYNNLRNPHKWQLTFNLKVNANAIPDGDTLRVWLPFPMETTRQTNVKFLKSSDPIKVSQGTFHTTAYMEGVAHKDQPTNFSITYSFVSHEQHSFRCLPSDFCATQSVRCSE